MSDSEWICKFCGSDDIVAEVEIRVDREVGGKIRERDGKPYFDEDWHYMDLDADDGSIIAYACVNGHTAARIEHLVVRRRVFAEMSLPCGRCDHGVLDHDPGTGSLSSDDKERGFTRPPMPCSHEGCNCHDYYDQAIGRESTDQQERMAA